MALIEPAALGVVLLAAEVLAWAFVSIAIVLIATAVVGDDRAGNRTGEKAECEESLVAVVILTLLLAPVSGRRGRDADEHGGEDDGHGKELTHFSLPCLISFFNSIILNTLCQTKITNGNLSTHLCVS